MFIIGVSVMYLWIALCGNDEKIPQNDEFEAYELLKAVFDNASNFKLENTMSLGGGGGIDGMGCTNLHYKSESGGNIYLSIDGGFPIPESACLDFDCDGYFHEFMKDICVAFGEYYKKDFGYYRLIVTSNCKGKGFVCIELYESEKQFNRIAEY